MNTSLLGKYLIISALLFVPIYGTESNNDAYDLCIHNPCYNNGKCVLTTINPGYKCRCSGSGYYGDRCQHACPNARMRKGKHSSIPYECVII